MALQIGGGITIGGNISIQLEAAAVSMVSGTITMGYTAMGNRWGSQYGSTSLVPNNIVNGIEYNVDSNFTIFYLYDGTFGSYTINASGVNGNPTLSVTIDGVTQTSSNIGDLGGIITWIFTGNPFSLDNTNPHTISIN